MVGVGGRVVVVGMQPYLTTPAGHGGRVLGVEGVVVGRSRVCPVQSVGMGRLAVGHGEHPLLIGWW